MIRCPGRKTPAARSGWFAFRVAPPRRHPAPPQLRSACRAVWRPSAPLLGTSKAIHPVGRAHGFDLAFRPTKPDAWNAAGLWVKEVRTQICGSVRVVIKSFKNKVLIAGLAYYKLLHAVKQWGKSETKSARRFNACFGLHSKSTVRTNCLNCRQGASFIKFRYRCTVEYSG